MLTVPDSTGRTKQSQEILLATLEVFGVEFDNIQEENDAVFMALDEIARKAINAETAIQLKL
jgi:hypothetical protein